MQIAGGGAGAVASRREDGVANFEWLLAEGADLAVPASPRFVAADENTPENNLLYRVPGGLPIFTFKAGTRYHSAGYTLDPGRIERLLEGEVPAVLVAGCRKNVLQPDA